MKSFHLNDETEFYEIILVLPGKYLKFGNGDGPNLCRVEKVDASSTFILIFKKIFLRIFFVKIKLYVSFS